MYNIFANFELINDDLYLLLLIINDDNFTTCPDDIITIYLLRDERQTFYRIPFFFSQL